MRVAKRNKPYRVHELGHEDFFDFKSFLSQIIKGRVKDKDREVVRWTKIKWFRSAKEDIKTVYIKYELSDQSFKKMQVAQRAARATQYVKTPQQFQNEIFILIFSQCLLKCY